MVSIRAYIDLVEAAFQKDRGGDARRLDRFETEKWIRASLDSAGIRASVEHGVVYVQTAQDQQRAVQVIADNPALRQRLPVKVRP